MAGSSKSLIRYKEVTLSQQFKRQPKVSNQADTRKQIDEEKEEAYNVIEEDEAKRGEDEHTKAKENLVEARNEADIVVKKKRGRPKGGTNKLKRTSSIKATKRKGKRRGRGAEEGFITLTQTFRRNRERESKEREEKEGAAAPTKDAKRKRDIKESNQQRHKGPAHKKRGTPLLSVFLIFVSGGKASTKPQNSIVRLP